MSGRLRDEVSIWISDQVGNDSINNNQQSAINIFKTLPVVFRYKGYRFFFYSNEGDPREPLHIHVRKGEAVVKFWLEPAPSVSESYALSSGELKELLNVALENKEQIRRFWDEHFSE